MSLVSKIKYLFLIKGKLANLQFSDGFLLLKEKYPSTRIITLRPNEVKFFSYSKSQPLIGLKFLGIKSTKGDFVLRSEFLGEEVYFKMLDFLGLERLVSIQKKIIRPPLLMAIVLFVLGMVSYKYKYSNIYYFLFFLGIVNIAGAISIYKIMENQIRDCKKN